MSPNTVSPEGNETRNIPTVLENSTVFSEIKFFCTLLGQIISLSAEHGANFDPCSLLAAEIHFQLTFRGNYF